MQWIRTRRVVRRSGIKHTEEQNVVAVMKDVPSEQVVYVGRTDTNEEWIPANAIIIPDEYQRNLSPTWVKTIARNFDMKRLTKIDVNRRPDGTIVVVDGQHRLSALRLVYGETAELRVLCQVHRLTTVEAEANLFLALNHYVKKTNARETFDALLASGDDEAVQARNVAAEFGYQLVSAGRHWRDGQLPAGSVMRLIRRQGDRRTPDMTHMRHVLGVIRDVYGEQTSQVLVILMTGLSSFISQYWDHPLFDRKRLVYALKLYGPHKLARDVVDIRAALRTSENAAGRKVILHAYNHKLQTRRLPDV